MEKRYNLVQVSKILGVQVRTVREWIRAGKLKATKYPTSNRWFVTESEIKRIIG